MFLVCGAACVLRLDLLTRLDLLDSLTSIRLRLIRLGDVSISLEAACQRAL